MMTLLFILWGILAICLLIIGAVKPQRAKHSQFELKRRGDDAALRRERLLSDIYALRRALGVLLIVLLSSLAWLIAGIQGIFLVGITLLAIALLSRLKSVNTFVMKLYTAQEAKLLRFVEKFRLVGWILGSERKAGVDQRLESQEHLVHLVEMAGHILSAEQQKLIKKGLDWHQTEIRTVMTPVGDIISVPKSELLGPLVLNDLHVSGHRRFPVTGSGIDHVVGQLNISELLEVDAGKKSETAERAMKPLEVRLYPDTPLPEALRQLMDHPGQLGLVVNEDGGTEGLFTLRDVLSALLGKRL